MVTDRPLGTERLKKVCGLSFDKGNILVTLKNRYVGFIKDNRYEIFDHKGNRLGHISVKNTDSFPARMIHLYPDVTADVLLNAGWMRNVPFDFWVGATEEEFLDQSLLNPH